MLPFNGNLSSVSPHPACNLIDIRRLLALSASALAGWRLTYICMPGSSPGPLTALYIPINAARYEKFQLQDISPFQIAMLKFLTQILLKYPSPCQIRKKSTWSGVAQTLAQATNHATVNIMLPTLSSGVEYSPCNVDITVVFLSRILLQLVSLGDISEVSSYTCCNKYWLTQQQSGSASLNSRASPICPSQLQL